MRIAIARIWRSVIVVFAATVSTISASAVTFTKASLKGGYSFLINHWTDDDCAYRKLRLVPAGVPSGPRNNVTYLSS